MSDHQGLERERGRGRERQRERGEMLTLNEDDKQVQTPFCPVRFSLNHCLLLVVSKKRDTGRAGTLC